MSICGGIAGARGCNPIGFFIHNDAGGASLNADWWANAYATGRHDLNNGFVHYHVDKDHVVQCEDDCNVAWHCGDYYCNRMYLSLEIDKSMGASDADFLAAEDRALRFVADKFNEYGISPNANTVRLHQEVYATACPHRSVALHGGADSCKQYFINKIAEYMNGEQPQPEMEDFMGSECIFTKSDGANYWWNGMFYIQIPSENDQSIIERIYRDNHNGNDMPHYIWDNNEAWWCNLDEISRIVFAKKKELEGTES